jgi:hypothetical protein
MELHYEKYLFLDVHVGYKEETKRLCCSMKTFFIFHGFGVLQSVYVRPEFYMIELTGF